MSSKILLVGLCGAALCAYADSKIADAAMNGDRAAVQSLIQQKADVNAPQGDGSTALHWAAYRDDVQMVNMLLAAGANVKAETRDGAITPLFMACSSADPAIVEAMLKAGADANAVKSNGTTALMMAADSGSVAEVQLLVGHGAKVNTKESVHGQTAIMFAAARGRDGVVRFLLAHGADPNVATEVRKLERVRFDQDGNIVEDRAGAGGAGGANAELDALAHAIGLESAVYAIDTAAAAHHELDVFARAAGMKGSEYFVDIARKKGPRAGDIGNRPPRKIGPDFQGGMTALLYAAREGHMATVQALVEGGANVNEVSGGEKMSPMIEAIINGHLDIAKYLLDHGADPKLTDGAGLTALYATVDVQWVPKTWFPQPSVDQEKTNYLDLMNELIAKGADVNAQIGEKVWFRSFTNDYTWVDTAGATAFWRAAQSSDLPAMKLLVEHGADPKIATKAGETPLEAAAGIGWAWNWSTRAPFPAVDAVKFCVEHGNDVNAADARGYTALHGAGFLGDNDMVNYLVSKGAKVDVKTKAGDSPADMANGPTRFGQPKPETLALLEKLGSPNSHNCRSDQCVVAAKANIYGDRQEAVDPVAKAELTAFAKAAGYSDADYHSDTPAAGPGRGAGRRGAGVASIAEKPAASETKPPASETKPAETKPPAKGPGK
ncbi:MAG TPA: ankyrin repeat domain-containing protein [Bryobacteraceae bacterium]|nr:ankyrin repeat domain-containing protein [Bryobacteraceae bacterium]